MGCKLCIAFFLVCFLLSAGSLPLCPQVVDMGETPDLKVFPSVHFPGRQVSEGRKFLAEFIHFMSFRLAHRTKSEIPGNDVCNQIGNLNAGSQIAMHKEGFGKHQAGS